MPATNIRIRPSRNVFSFVENGKKCLFPFFTRDYNNVRYNYTFGDSQDWNVNKLVATSIRMATMHGVFIQLYRYENVGKLGYATYYARITGVAVPDAHVWFKADGTFVLRSAGDGFDFWYDMCDKANKNIVSTMSFFVANKK